MGGGERYSGMLAAVLADQVDSVELLTHDEVDLEAVGAHLGIDLAKVSLRVVPDTGEADLTDLTADYDVFVNASYMSRLAGRARRNLYVVYFPTPHDHDLNAVQRLLLRRLGPWAATPGSSFEHGRGWFPPEGGRRRTWSWTGGDGVVVVTGGESRRLTFDVGRPGATKGSTLTVWAGEERLRDVAVIPGVFTPVTLDLPPARHGTELHFRSDTFRPGAADARSLGVAVSRLRAGGRSMSLRQRLGYRLPYLRRDPYNLEFLTSYSRVISISEYTRSWVRRYWGVESDVLFPPVATDAVVAGPKVDRILSVGRFFGPGRGHDKKQLEMVRAFVDLRRRGLLEGWDYHLVGGSSPEDEVYVAAVRAAAAGQPVHIHANAPRTVLRELLESSRVFWHATGLGEDVAARPWLFEHFGITTVEAMAAGCVPVVIASAGQLEIVRDGVDGFRFSTVAQLQDATLRVAGSQQLQDRLAAAARDRANVFSEGAFAERWRALSGFL